MSTTETQQITLRAFITRYRIRMDDPAWVDRNPNMTDMPPGSRHFKLTLRCGSRQLTIPYSQGPAIERKPELADVLDCLASDASGIENARSFEDWCGEYGYDTDSRKAERTYRAVKWQTDGLRRLLNDSTALETLLYQTERL